MSDVPDEVQRWTAKRKAAAPEREPAMDPVRREFTAAEPNRVWFVPTSPTCRPGKAGCSSPWSWTPARSASSAGRCVTT